jgi:hypothetical protein
MVSSFFFKKNTETQEKEGGAWIERDRVGTCGSRVTTILGHLRRPPPTAHCSAGHFLLGHHGSLPHCLTLWCAVRPPIVAPDYNNRLLGNTNNVLLYNLPPSLMLTRHSLPLGSSFRVEIMCALWFRTYAV